MDGVSFVVGLLILVALVAGAVIVLNRTQRRAHPLGFRPNAARADADNRRTRDDLRFRTPIVPPTPPVEVEPTVRVRGWLTT